MGRTKVLLCNHVKANGSICESPALKDEAFCFFHQAARERVKRQRRAARHKLPFQLPILEDAESIQLAIGDTLNALLSGQIDHKTAGLVLYGLQTAAGNVRHASFRTSKNSRRYDHYHNQEEEILEQEIQEEIEQEQNPAPAPSDPPAQEVAAAVQPANFAELPPRKSVSSEPGLPDSFELGALKKKNA